MKISQYANATPLGVSSKLIGTNVSANDETANFTISDVLALRPDAEMYMINNTTDTVVATVNVPVKVEGTTTSGVLSGFTMPSNNRLTYTGTSSVTVFASVSFTAYRTAGSDATIEAVVYKNGTTPQVNTTTKTLITLDRASGLSQGFITLATNDYIELWLVNTTDATDVLVNTMNFSVV